jgi:DNA invertase Pin-like site-specific DNA recombinase
VEESVNTGVSGAKSNRPARNRLAEAARRQFDLGLVLRLDRWGRSVADCVRPQGGGKLTDGPVHDFDHVGLQ